MDKMYRFMAKHRFVSKILGSAFLCGAYTWLFLIFHLPTWLIVLFDLLFIFLTHVVVDNSAGYLMKKPVAELDDNCNPIPLLEEMEEILGYNNTDLVQQMLMINYALAQRCIGNFDKAYEILSSINIDKNAGMLPISKVVYYNNLMDACMLSEKYEEAVVWYSKLKQIYADIKDSKQKAELEETIKSAEAIYYFCKKEYDKALDISNGVVSMNRRMKVENTWFCAKLLIQMGDMQAAKEKLTYVAENGKQLYCAKEAKELLSQI